MGNLATVAGALSAGIQYRPTMRLRKWTSISFQAYRELRMTAAIVSASWQAGRWTFLIIVLCTLICFTAGTLQYQRSACDKQYLPERRSGSKIFAGTALRRVPAPLHPWTRLNLWRHSRDERNKKNSVRKDQLLRVLLNWYPTKAFGTSFYLRCFIIAIFY